MKHFGLIYKNHEELKKFINELKVEPTDQILVQIFTGIIDTAFIKSLIDEVNFCLPNAEIIGLTTAGEIFEGKILSHNTIFSFTIFDNVKIKTILIKNEDNEVEIGNKIFKKLVNEDTKLIILFSDGLFSDGSDIITTIQSYNKNLKICGAKAADNNLLKNTYVFTKDGILSVGFAAVSLSSNKITVNIQSSFCWSSIGKTMKITKSFKNRIFTIDDIPAVEVYKKYLGINIEKNLTLTTTEFPLIIKNNGIDIARVAYKAYEDGSLDFYGNVSVGDEVQFGYGNINMITEKSLELIESFSKKPNDLIFIYSCYVRKAFLGRNINMEIEPLNNIAPCFGSFTYGEFFSNDSNNPLFNVTMLIVGITDNSKEIKKINYSKSSYNVPSSKNELEIIKTFSNLANQVILELQEANLLLKSQKKLLERLQNASNSILDINNRIIYYNGDNTIFNIILDKIIELIPSAEISSIFFIKDNLTYYSSNGSQFEYYIKNINNYLIESNFQDNHKIRAHFSPIIINPEKDFYEDEIKKLKLNKTVINPIELLTCSIELEDNSVAIINIFSGSKNRFSVEDISIVEHMAYEIAIIFKNAKFLERIMYLYKYDRLTGIYNRNYYVEIIHTVYKKALINKDDFVICVIDLDKFKEINDKFGHDVGDLYLIKFISILKCSILKEDFFGRIGGDEFEIFFMNKNEMEVSNIIKTMYNNFKNDPFVYKDFSRIIEFSYGLSKYPDDSEKLRDLIKLADNRMYANKGAKSNKPL